MSRTALAVRDAIVAIMGVANLLYCTLASASALMIAVSVMMIGAPMYATVDRLRTPTPRAAPVPAKLALEAKDQAAEAADLGLPTGVWIDLAATWTTWADQEEAEKAPEASRERPRPPSGGGGAGNARHTVPWVTDGNVNVLHALTAMADKTSWPSIATAEDWDDLERLLEADSYWITLHSEHEPGHLGLGQVARSPAPVLLARQKSGELTSNTVTFDIKAGSTVEHFAVWTRSGELVTSNALPSGPERFPHGGTYSMAVQLTQGAVTQ